MTLAEDAKRLYESRLRRTLEATNFGDYVAIEPESGAHFIGSTFLAAALAAKDACPNEKLFVFRIGQEAAFHIGAATQ